MNNLINYKMKGGGTVSSDSKKGIVEEIRKLSFNPCETIIDFMYQTASACALQTGVRINTNHYTGFLNSLKEHGFLEEMI